MGLGLSHRGLSRVHWIRRRRCWGRSLKMKGLLESPQSGFCQCYHYMRSLKISPDAEIYGLTNH